MTSDALVNQSSRLLLFGLLVLLIAACGEAAPVPTVQATTTLAATVEVPATRSTQPAPPLPTALPTSTPPTGATSAPADTPAAAVTPTTDPYAGLTIADLTSRRYGDGQLSVQETIHVTDSFTRTLVAYPSDGLTVYGFMNVPFGSGPFPVALVLHGYIPPRQYGTIGYTTRYADHLARAGYLVIHPNYRNHPPSDETAGFAAGREEADFRVGYAIDVLNLMAIVRTQGGQPGPLARANPDQMHLLGHSMGGGIALRVMTVRPEAVDATALYGSMSADEYENYERIQIWSEGQSGQEELSTPPEDMRRIAPVHFLDRIQAAVSIHHGQADDVVPPEWSDELCLSLRELGKDVECFNYPDAPHTFQDAPDRLFQQRVLDFFNRY